MYKSKTLNLLAVLSILIVSSLPLYLKFFIWPSYDQFVIGNTEKGLRFLAAQMIQGQRFREPLSATRQVPAELIEEVERIRRTVGLPKVKIFTPQGLIVYSSDAKDIGNFTRHKFFPLMLLDGQPRSELARKEIRQANGQMVSHDMIETYMPILADGLAIGAFEVYFDVTEINHSLHALMGDHLRVMVPAAMALLLAALVSTYFANKSMQALAEAKEHFKEQAVTDPLTGLLNYRGFKHSVKRQLKIIDRGDKYAFLIFIDLNDFKKINDTLGHEVGDRALVEASEILVNTFRESDMIARFNPEIIGRLGGDEFAIFTTQNGALADEQAIGRRLEEQISRWNATHHEGYTISMSYGIIPYLPKEDSSLSELLKRADALMYANKQQRKQMAKEAPLVTG